MIEHYDFVQRIAKKLYKNNVSVYYLGEIDDVIQIGVIGLLKARKDFKECKNKNFKAYAYLRIRGEILDAARNQSALINIPKSALKAGHKYYKIESISSVDSHNSNSGHGYAGYDPVDYREIYRDKVHGIKENCKEDIKRLLRTLSTRHIYMLIRYYGLNDEVSLTMKEIAEDLGVNESRISQLFMQLKEHIRNTSFLQDYAKAS